ncbi:MAG: DUF1015 family protein [Myxococcota bacterium]
MAGQNSEYLDPIQATLLPFRAFRYNPQHPEVQLGALVAPPGESGGAESKRHAAQNPYHALRLFPTSGGKSNPAALEHHEREGLHQTLRAWQDAQVLLQDPTPALYLHTLSFSDETGRRETRRGFFAMLALREEGSVRILPHENTLPARLTRQVQIFEALALQPLPIFLSYSDPQNLLLARLEPLAEPLLSFTDALEQQHTLARVPAQALEGWFESLLAGRELLIADGHHRFDALRELWRQHGGVSSPAFEQAAGAEALVGVYLTPMEASGFKVGAIHRVIKRLTQPTEALERLAEVYTLQRHPLPELPAAGDREALRQWDREVAHQLLEALQRKGTGAFALLPQGERVWLLLESRRDVAHPSLASCPEALQALDVSRLASELLPALAGAHSLEVEYEKDVLRAIREVREGTQGLALLLNPMTPEQILNVARAGLVMPPKATYFYPKIAAGLVAMALPGKHEP